MLMVGLASGPETVLAIGLGKLAQCVALGTLWGRARSLGVSADLTQVCLQEGECPGNLGALRRIEGLELAPGPSYAEPPGLAALAPDARQRHWEKCALKHSGLDLLECMGSNKREYDLACGYDYYKQEYVDCTVSDFCSRQITQDNPYKWEHSKYFENLVNQTKGTTENERSDWNSPVEKMWDAAFCLHAADDTLWRLRDANNGFIKLYANICSMEDGELHYQGGVDAYYANLLDLYLAYIEIHLELFPSYLLNEIDLGCYGDIDNYSPPSYEYSSSNSSLISHGALQEIPSNICLFTHFTRMAYIYIYNQSLTSIPDLSCFNNLTRVDLGLNPINMTNTTNYERCQELQEQHPYAEIYLGEFDEGCPKLIDEVEETNKKAERKEKKRKKERRRQREEKKRRREQERER